MLSIISFYGDLQSGNTCMNQSQVPSAFSYISQQWVPYHMYDFINYNVSICFCQTLCRHLLYYKKENLDCDNAMELYDELPKNRQETLKSVQS